MVMLKDFSQGLPFNVNLLPDGAVVTRDGEILGTWGTDETDAIYEFTPNGSSGATISHPFVSFLCERIHKWHSGQT